MKRYPCNDVPTGGEAVGGSLWADGGKILLHYQGRQKMRSCSTGGTSNRRVGGYRTHWAAMIFAANLMVPCLHGFGMPLLVRNKKTRARVLKKDYVAVLAMSLDENEQQDEENFGDGGHSAMNDLSWRVEKLRLEEQNTKRFLKAGPRFLPYEECRKWVQAWSRWDNEQDWRDWISMGEKRNPYVPARPDEYYGRLGKWISWEHFLLEDKGDEEVGEFS